MPKRKTLNDEIREVRLAAGLTQYELGAAIKVPQDFLSRLEGGTKKLNARHLIAICKATNGTFVIDKNTRLAIIPLATCPKDT